KAAEETADAAAGAEHSLAGEQRKHELRSRQRGHAQQQADLRAEAAAVDQDQALAALGELICELPRDPAAERVADEGGAPGTGRGISARAVLETLAKLAAAAGGDRTLRSLLAQRDPL